MNSEGSPFARPGDREFDPSDDWVGLRLANEATLMLHGAAVTAAATAAAPSPSGIEKTKTKQRSAKDLRDHLRISYSLYALYVRQALATPTANKGAGMRRLWRVLFDYAPQNEDELKLKAGDFVWIDDKLHGDDWWGHGGASGKKGLFFPASCTLPRQLCGRCEPSRGRSTAGLR